MKLQEVFDQLTSGELSQLSIGGQAAGVIDENNWAKVLPHLNLGLTALYSRFLLKEGRLTLEMVPDQTVYRLKSAYAQSNTRSSELVKYIADDADTPFKDDIVKIERVLVESNVDLVLNDAADPFAVTSTTATTLKVPLEIVNQDADLPDWLKTETLQVVYRANAPLITIPIGYFDPSRVEVELPYTHLWALLCFVASRVNAPLGAGQLEGVAGATWYARYEAACLDLTNAGLSEQRTAGTDKLRDRGFA